MTVSSFQWHIYMEFTGLRHRNSATLNPRFANDRRLDRSHKRGAIHTTKESDMADEARKQCAHEPCQCMVAADEKYCSDYCKAAGSEEVEIACDCDHEACQL